jgi:hypothetical protein
MADAVITSQPNLLGPDLSAPQQPQQPAPPQEASNVLQADDMDPLFAGLFDQPKADPSPAPTSPNQPALPQAPQQPATAPQTAPPATQTPQPVQSAPDEVARLKAEYEAYRTQVEQIAPIMRYVQENPELRNEVYSLVDRTLKGQLAQKEQEPQPPTAPERPAAYNEADAYSDPASESWRYRVQAEQYRDQMAEYRVRQAEARTERLERFIQERAAQEAEQRKLGEVYQYALGKGASHEQAQAYVNFVTKKQVTQDDVWNLFTLTHQPQAVHMNVPVNTPPAQPQLPVNRQPLQVPLPTVAATGQNGTVLTPTQQLFEGMLAVEKRSNPLG